MTEQGDHDLQRQIDELVATVRANERAIAGLTERAEASDQRAEEMEARALVDRELVAELQADGLLSREHVVQLEEALLSSRTIGAALGILMSQRHIGQAEALMVLKGASSRTNIKLRDLAQTIVAGADAI